jgi:hypothetical protein
MAVLPLPFENDDEDAAADALGRLNDAVAHAHTRRGQDAALEKAIRFINHERGKRQRKPIG